MHDMDSGKLIGVVLPAPIPPSSMGRSVRLSLCCVLISLLHHALPPSVLPVILHRLLCSDCGPQLAHAADQWFFQSHFLVKITYTQQIFWPDMENNRLFDIGNWL